MLIIICFSACDGFIRVKGSVYRQTPAQGESQAFINEDAKLPAELTPLNNAKITVYQTDDEKKWNTDTHQLWKDTGETNEKGEFDVGGAAPPFEIKATLVVEAPGYKTVKKVFSNGKINSHNAIIMLVPVNDDK